MSKAPTTPSQSRTVDKALKAAWAAAGILALYAVVVPTSLLGLGSLFWGIVLFFSIIAFPLGITTDRVSNYLFATVLLAMTIAYVAILRRHDVGLGDPLSDLALIRGTYPSIIGFTCLIAIIMFAGRKL